jgi:hypothetical protein
VIEDGVTGFLVSSAAEAARVIDRVVEIDPVACRQRVHRCFSIQTMVEGYERVYSTIFELEAKKRL